MLWCSCQNISCKANAKVTLRSNIVTMTPFRPAEHINCTQHLCSAMAAAYAITSASGPPRGVLTIYATPPLHKLIQSAGLC